MCAELQLFFKTSCLKMENLFHFINGEGGRERRKEGARFSAHGVTCGVSTHSSRPRVGCSTHLASPGAGLSLDHAGTGPGQLPARPGVTRAPCGHPVGTCQRWLQMDTAKLGLEQWEKSLRIAGGSSRARWEGPTQAARRDLGWDRIMG